MAKYDFMKDVSANTPGYSSPTDFPPSALEAVYNVIGRTLDDSKNEKIQELISQYSPFDPRWEIEDLYYASYNDGLEIGSNDSRDQLLDYKSKLEQQTVGVAQLVSNLYETIYANPNISGDDLWAIVARVAPDLRLTRQHLGDFWHGILDYRSKHLTVVEYAKNYRNSPDRLFEDCFNRTPAGKVELVVGPMTLMLRCFYRQDYAAATDNEDSWGSAFSKVALEDLDGIVTIENVTVTPLRTGSEDTPGELVRHEDQHQFNRLFTPHYSWRTVGRPIDPQKYEHLPKAERVNKLVKSQALRLRRSMGIDSQARDEIIASYRGGSTGATIYGKLATNPMYIYKQDDTNEIKENPEPLRHFFEAQDLGGLELDLSHDDLVAEFDYALGPKYLADVKKWISAIGKLEAKGYEPDWIVGFLYHLPENVWVPMARRMPPHLVTETLLGQAVVSTTR